MKIKMNDWKTLHKTRSMTIVVSTIHTNILIDLDKKIFFIVSLRMNRCMKKISANEYVFHVQCVTFSATIHLVIKNYDREWGFKYKYKYTESFWVMKIGFEVKVNWQNLMK